MRRMGERFREIVGGFSADAVLIYQMGKVGSTSLEVSLAEARHFHTLYGNPPCSLHRKRWRRNPARWVSKAFGSLLKRTLIRRRERVKIISLVREPYGRNISMFFQDLPYWMIEYQSGERYDSRREGAEFLYETFEKVYDHFYFDHWFDREIKRLTGIDVFAYPFDKERGHTRIRKGRYDLLLLKLEKLEEAHAAIEAFVGYPFTMRATNLGERKWYACIYADFIRQYRPPEGYLDGLYATKTVRHFYTDDEIEGFKTKHAGAVS